MKTTKWFRGQRVLVRKDDALWGRIASPRTVLEVRTKSLLVSTDAVRANVVVAKNGVIILASRVFSANGHEFGELTGRERRCGLHGCMGTRFQVRWRDGKGTWPCSRGMKIRADGQWQAVD